MLAFKPTVNKVKNMERDTFFPAEENLGRDCMFWSVGETAVGCCFPKAEMKGRTSCEGVIDDVCLFLKTGRRPDSLTEEQIMELKIRAPDLENKLYIPPGDII